MRFRTAIVCFVLAFTGIAGLVGFIILRKHLAEERAESSEIVGDIGEIAGLQIEDWRSHKVQEAEFIGNAPFLQESVARHLSDPESGSLNDVRATLELFKRRFKSFSVALYDLRGMPICSTVGASLAPPDLSLLNRSLESRNTLFGDPQQVGGEDGFRISIASPMIPASKPDKPIAVVVVEVGLQDSLGGLLRSSRSSSRTLDTVLVAKVGARSVFLNRPRFRDSGVMNLAFADKISPTLKTTGPTIVEDLADYRGQKVIAAVRDIPGTTWRLITKMDMDEVDAELKGRVALVSAVFAFFLLAQAFGIGLLWHSKESSLLAERLREEKGRREGFERMALLMSAANDAVLVSDAEGHVVESNEAAEELYGYTALELRELTVHNLQSPDGAKPLLSTGMHEELHVNKLGECFPVEVSGRTIDWGETSYRIHVVRDIRTRKAAERQLELTIGSLEQAMQTIRTSEQRFRSFVEASSLTVWRADSEGNVFELSEPHSDFAVRGGQAGFGRGWLSSLHPDDASLALDSWHESVRSQTPLQIEVRRKATSGDFRYLEIRAIPIFDNDGNVLEWIGASRDIDEHKKAEQLLLQSQKMEALGNIAGGIAHDFNNILRAIAGNVRLAYESLPERHSARTTLTQVEQSCYRAFNLVQQVLTFSRESETRLKPIDLEKVVQEAVSLLRPTIPSAIELGYEVVDKLPSVRSDSSQAHQALLNLVGNSVQAMEGSGGTIAIELSNYRVQKPLGKLEPGNYVRLSVRDNGPGIEPLIQKRIFEPFFTTKPQGQGTGLGLSVVHGIMATHGGSVEVESKVGVGTVFHLYFPTTTESPKKPKKAPPSATSGTIGRVLYVDDDDSLIKLASRSLPRKGIDVVGVTSPEAAIKLFEEDPYGFDAVVTDITMPTMSGFEVASHISEVRPDIPIVALSGFIRNEDSAEAERVGICKLLLKTLGDEELVETLSSLISRREAIPA